MTFAAVSCEGGGKDFEVKTEYFQIFGTDAYCQDCLIHTKCQSCERGLRLKPSRYKELGGEPVICTDCGEPAESPSTQGGMLSGTFWEGLTWGEKSVFPVLLAIFIASVGLLVWARAQGMSVDAGVVPGGLLFLILWTYWRGRKNRP